MPVTQLTSLYDDVKEYTDLPALLLKQIEHFFEHYKDLESGKWVKVEGWKGKSPTLDLVSKTVGRRPGYICRVTAEPGPRPEPAVPAWILMQKSAMMSHGPGLKTEPPLREYH